MPKELSRAAIARKRERLKSRVVRADASGPGSSVISSIVAFGFNISSNSALKLNGESFTQGKRVGVAGVGAIRIAGTLRPRDSGEARRRALGCSSERYARRWKDILTCGSVSGILGQRACCDGSMELQISKSGYEVGGRGDRNKLANNAKCQIYTAS